MNTRPFDTIIVGAGPAGCVLASRLTESSDHGVLLIDAGPDYGPDPADWPSELLDPVGPVLDTHSWGYSHHVDENARHLMLPRGRVFGGCSSVNSCIWLHGSRVDYDHWAELGNPGWDYSSLAPIFSSAERDPLCASSTPGDHLIDVWRAPDSGMSEIERAMIVAADELGIPNIKNLNGSPVQSPAV